MITRKKKFSLKLIVLLLSLSVMLGISSTALAKARLNVGFTQTESMKSLLCDESWQYLEESCMVWQLIYDQLWILGPAPDYKPQPMLATRWETKDKKTWTFYLNKNAKFHDGKPVTAADVVFTIKYLPGADPAWDLPDFDVEDIHAVDDHTVQITMPHSWGGLYPPAYWIPILPKHIWEPYKKKMLSFDNAAAIGSGPYKLKKFKPGQYIWLERNNAYHGEKAKFQEVVMKTYGGGDAIDLALKKGDIDFLGYRGASPITIPDFEKNKNIKVVTAPGVGIDYLAFNQAPDTAIRDIAVRRAIMHGINKDRIVKLVYHGYAQSIDSFIYPELPLYDKNLPQYSYDPAKANSMLAKAGYVDSDGNGIRNDPKRGGKDLEFSLMVPSDWSEEVKAVRLIKEQLKEIGINIKMKIIDLDTFYDFVYKPKDEKFDLALMNDEPGPHSDWMWEYGRSYNNGGEGWNLAYYNNPKYDKHLDAFLKAETQAERIKQSHALQKIMATDLPYGILVRPDKIDPVRIDRIKGYVTTMGGVSIWINPWTYFKASPVK